MLISNDYFIKSSTSLISAYEDTNDDIHPDPFHHISLHYRLSIPVAEGEKERERGRERGRYEEEYSHIPSRTPITNGREKEREREDDDDESQVVYNRQDNSVPDYLLRGSMTETQPPNSHPLALRTAISALRFAMRHPLTNHSTVRVTRSNSIFMLLPVSTSLCRVGVIKSHFHLITLFVYTYVCAYIVKS